MLGNGTDSERLPFVLLKLEQTERVVIDMQDEIDRLTRERDEVARNAVTVLDDMMKDLKKAERERDEAIATAVWAAKHLASFDSATNELNWVDDQEDPYFGRGFHSTKTDGTASDIYRALRAAKESTDGGK